MSSIAPQIGCLVISVHVQAGESTSSAATERPRVHTYQVLPQLTRTASSALARLEGCGRELRLQEASISNSTARPASAALFFWAASGGDWLQHPALSLKSSIKTPSKTAASPPLCTSLLKACRIKYNCRSESTLATTPSVRPFGVIGAEYFAFQRM